MAVRTGAQYIAGLKDEREVWLDDKKINVVEDSAMAGSVQGMAGYYDWQHKYAEDCIVEDPETGQPMSGSHIIPRNAEDLQKRHRTYDRLARYSYGMLGRTPDYCNTSLAGQVGRKDLWEKGDMKFWENIRNFRREVIDGDLSLTHTIIHAAIDRSIGELNGANADLTLKVIKRDANGITVRGAKVLATLGPFADELFVYPASAPLQKGYEDYAVAFSIPVKTKGVIQICRDHYGTKSDVQDQPFSSRFDEQDTFVIFDDVEIPWERVFIDGNIEIFNGIGSGVFPGNVLQQTTIRAAVKLEFAYDLCVQMAKVTNSDKYPPVAQMLGEIYTYAYITKQVTAAAEAKAYDWGAGCFFCDGDLSILRNVMPGWMIRVNEIIDTIGGHNLLCTPSHKAFEHPELGPKLRKYLPGSNGIPAEQRAQIMRTAWDFAGSALGSRVELYERNYLASAGRNMVTDHFKAQAQKPWDQVSGFLKESGILPKA